MVKTQLPTFQVPSNLDEANLGQMISANIYRELVDKERTKQENADFSEALQIITDLTPNQLQLLDKKTLDANHEAIQRFFDIALAQSLHLMANPVHYPKFLNRIVTPIDESILEDEMLYRKSEYEGAKNYFRRREFKKKYTEAKVNYENTLKPQMFYIEKDYSTLPAGIWMNLLDGVIKQVEQIPPQEFYKVWNMIPTIIASIAWREDEPKLKMHDGKLFIDQERIQYFSSVFLNRRASDAIRLVAFFLNTRADSWLKSVLEYWSSQLTTPTHKAAENEKITTKGGDGKGTS